MRNLFTLSIITIKTAAFIVARPILRMLFKPTIDERIIREFLKRRVDELKRQSWSITKISLIPETYRGELEGIPVNIDVYLLEYLEGMRKAHIGICIDDGSFVLESYPISSDFIAKLNSES